MDVGSLAGTTSKYEIPVSNLDYDFIDKCTDVKHLEKILKVLRSGKEGKYPHLEDFAEKKLESLNPKSKVLLKEAPIQKITDLPKNKQKEIFDDIDSWASQMTENSHHDDNDHSVTNGDIGDQATNGTDYPVRSSTVIASSQTPQKANSAENTKKKTSKRVTPRDYKEWDKLDVDAEIEKLEASEAQESKGGGAGETRKSTARSVSGLPRKIQVKGLSARERQVKAEKEKDKGNEAFRSGDYNEAEVYYSRSLSLVPNIAARNNRAQAYIKLTEWDKAIADANEVLVEDKDNIKAYMRRGVAYKGKSLFIEAKQDIAKVLNVEPNNKRAKDMMSEIEKALGEQKTKGRRMMIEESDSSDEDEEAGHEPEETGSDAKSEVAQNTDTVTASVSTTVGTEEQIPKEVTVSVNGSLVEESATSNDKSAESENGTTAEGDIKPVSKAAKEVVETLGIQQNGFEKESGTKAKEVESKETAESGENVQPMEQPPALEPVPPLPDGVVKLKDEGTQFFKTGRYAEALEKYNSAILKIEQDSRHEQNLAVLYSNRAACKMKNGDLKGCVEDSNLALTLTPLAVKPMLRRANAYEGLEKYRQAFVDYRQALLIDPAAQVAKQGASRCQSALQSLDGPKWREKLPAMADLQLPVPTSLPSSPPVLNQSNPAKKKVAKTVDKEAVFDEQKSLGNEFVKKGDFQAAIGCYTKCIESCPDKSVGFANRALCYLRTSQAELALEDSKEANRLEPANVKALFRQGQAYKMLKDYETSEQKLRQVLKLDAHNTAAKRELQVVLKYREEEQLKKKAESRKKIVIEESSSEEESDTESTEKPQQPTSQSKPVPAQTKSQPESSVNKVQDPKKDNSVHSAPSDIHSTASQNVDTSLLSSEKLPQSSEHDVKTKRSDSQPDRTQETKADKVHSGMARGGDVKYDLRVPKASSKIRPTAQMTEGSKTAPKLTKATGFEFMASWTVLKSTEDITPYMELLVQVEPNLLPAVISNKLEGEMVPIIGKCAGRLAEEGKASVGFQYLKYLTKVPRFQMNTMFMSETDKKALKSVFETFKSLRDPSFTPASVDVLSKEYGL